MEETIEKRFYYKLNKYKGSNKWNFSFYIYKLKVTSEWNMFYLHLLIGLIYSKKDKRSKIEFSVEGKKTVKIKRI